MIFFIISNNIFRKLPSSNLIFRIKKTFVGVIDLKNHREQELEV